MFFENDEELIKHIEEAQAQVERCKTWKDTTWGKSTIKHIPDSVYIEKNKPSNAIWKHFYKLERERILKNEKH